jgi:hypothetical protein
LGDGAAAFEAVTSSEVIEHLDPPDLARFWDIHLGTLKPNLLVVTTPNRYFNTLFEMVSALSGERDRSYAVQGLDYRVRHDDHRFEYTRAEFEQMYSPHEDRLNVAATWQRRSLSMMSVLRVLEQPVMRSVISPASSTNTPNFSVLDTQPK